MVYRGEAGSCRKAPQTPYQSQESSIWIPTNVCWHSGISFFSKKSKLSFWENAPQTKYQECWIWRQKRKYFCTVVLNFCQFINSRRKKALFAIYAFLQEFFLLRTLAEYFSFFKTCVWNLHLLTCFFGYLFFALLRLTPTSRASVRLYGVHSYWRRDVSRK